MAIEFSQRRGPEELDRPRGGSARSVNDRSGRERVLGLRAVLNWNKARQPDSPTAVRSHPA